jgi:tetrahydromethanopterin S-methyltransferase subunit B
VSATLDAMSPTPPMTLTGARRAILRSLYVAVFSASLTALVMCVLPGRQTVYAVAGAQVEPAGGPLLALAMIATTILTAIGLAVPRRETTVLAAGTLTVLSIPILIWLAITQLDEPGTDAHALWPAQVLDLALPIVVLAGPILGTLGFILFRLEARASVPPIPIATAR